MKAAFACAVAFTIFANHAQAGPRYDALVATGLDVSSSMTSDELRLQTEGMALALESPGFVQVATAGPHGVIGLTVYLWSDGQPVQVLPWTEIASQADAENAADILRKAIAESKPGSLTDTSRALEYGLHVIQAAGGQFVTDKMVLNIITNGADDNVGSYDTKPARDALISYGVTINGVALPCPCDVPTFLRANVTNGFVLRVTTPQEFPAVMMSKFRMDLM